MAPTTRKNRRQDKVVGQRKKTTKAKSPKQVKNVPKEIVVEQIMVKKRKVVSNNEKKKKKKKKEDAASASTEAAAAAAATPASTNEHSIDSMDVSEDLHSSSLSIAALVRNMQKRKSNSPSNSGDDGDEEKEKEKEEDNNKRMEDDDDDDDDDDDNGELDASGDIQIDNAENGEGIVRVNVELETNNGKWVEESAFANKEQLIQFLRSENCWSYRGCSNSIEGKRVLYRCNRVRRTSNIQCAAGIYTIEKISYGKGGDDNAAKETTSSFILYRKIVNHTHDQLPSNVVVPPKVRYEVEQMIIQQFKDGRKAKKIFYNLLDSDAIPMVDRPTHKQVVCVINNYKRNNFGEQPITMRQLTNFIEKNSHVPMDNVDKAFVIRFERSPPTVQGASNKFFRFFISTPRLLNVASKATIVHADATHKVTNEKLPLIAVGVTDDNAKFHFTGLTLSTHEDTDSFALTFRAMRSGIRAVSGLGIQPNVLVCDADGAIHNGFKHIFYPGSSSSSSDEDGDENDENSTEYLIVMYYFHVTLNIQNKYKFQMKGNKGPFKDDIYILHICGSEEQFDMGCKLFVKKWATIEPEATRLVQKSFFEKNKNWFIGCIPRSPKHNNGMEGFNSTMKRCQLEHQRQPLKQFLTTALSIVRQRSLEYLKGKEPYQPEVQIDRDIMKRGCELNLVYVNGGERPDGGMDFYTYCSGMQQTAKITIAVSAHKQRKYKTFADFAANSFDIWKITFPGDSNKWKEAFCSCPSFDKHFMCKHVIAIAKSLGLIASGGTAPVAEDFDDEPLFQLGRGRPKRATKALVVDESDN